MTMPEPAPYRRRARLGRDDERALVEAQRLVAVGYSEHAASVIAARGCHSTERYADRRIRRKLFQLRTANQ